MQQRDNGYPALNDHLLQQVLESTNIQAAWKQVSQNKGAAGSDGITILQFPGWVRPGVADPQGTIAEWPLSPATRQAGSHPQG